MVVCIVALVVFGFLGIFSAKYRTYAKEAFHCVVQMVQLKPCDTKFDQKMKAKITVKLLKRSPKLGRFVYRQFQIISAIFVIIMFVSFVLLAQGLYNVALYGNCDPHSDGFCIFDPGAGLSCGSKHCAEDGCDCGPKDTDCTAETGYAPCEGNCACDIQVCG